MTTYYEVLRAVTQSCLDTRPAFAKVLEAIPPKGRITFGEIKCRRPDRTS